jgi:hypothetical protein
MSLFSRLALRNPRKNRKHGMARRRRNRGSQLTRLAEVLEDRALLTVIWTNRDTPSDMFDSAFPGNADAARAVVDSAIDSWNQVVTGFGGSPFDVELNIAMDPDDPALSAFASGIVFDGATGVPESGSIEINMNGSIGNTNWFIDPTPMEHSEFQGTRVNTFARRAPSTLPNGDPNPANGINDLRSLLIHEMGHVMGIVSGSPLLYGAGADVTVTSLPNPDDTSGAAGDRFYLFQGNTINALMTDFDIGGTTTVAGHNARPRAGNASIQVGPTIVYGAIDTMIGTGISTDQRILLTNKVAMMMDDMGYDVVMPEVFGTMHTILDESTGLLTIDGGLDNILINGIPQGASDDVISISRTPTELIVRIDFGVDVPGTGPGIDPLDQQGEFESRFDIADVTDIVINGFGGDDEIDVFGLPAGIQLTINGGDGEDDIALGGFDLDSIDGTVTVNGDADSDSLSFNEPLEALPRTYTLNETTFTRSGINPVTYGGIQVIHINGGQAADTYIVNSTPDDTLVSVSTGGGGDSVHVTPAGDLDAIGGTLSINGGSQGPGEVDSLILDDSQHAGSESYTINSGAVTRFGLGLFAFTYSGIESLEVEGGTSTNVFEINGTADGVDVMVTGGGLNDTFQVANGDIDTNLGDGLLHIVGGANGDAGDHLILEDTGDAGNDNYTFDDEEFSKFNYLGTLTFDQIERVTLDANHDNNNVHVLRTPFGTGLTINVGSGTNTVFAGNDDFDSNIRGDLAVNGAFGFDTLVIRDQNDNIGNDQYVFDGPTDTTPATFDKTAYNWVTSYSSFVNAVVLEGSDFNNTVLLNGAGVGAAVTLNTRGGDDDIHVGSGDLEDFAELITVDGGAGIDDLFLHDETDDGDDVYWVGNNFALKSGFSLGYSNAESLTLNANPFNNTINVESVLETTPVTINAGDRSDSIHLAPTAQQLSFIQAAVYVDGQGGVDNVFLHDELSNPLDPVPFAVTHNSVTRPIPPFIVPQFELHYEEMERLLLQLGAADDLVDIQSTAPGMHVVVEGGAGGDTVLANVPTLAQLTLNGGVGVDTVTLLGTAASEEVSVSAGFGSADVNLIDFENAEIDMAGGTDVLAYHGVAGVDEEVEVHASTNANQGALGVVGSLDLVFENTELLDLLANPGDDDTATFLGSNQASEFEINLAADGTNVDPVLQLFEPDAAAPLLTLRDYRNFGTLGIIGSDDVDLFNVHVAPAGPGTGRNLIIDGGDPAGQGNGKDELNVFYQSPPNPDIDHDKDNQNDSGTFDIDYGGLHQFFIEYLNIEKALSKNANAAN